MITAIEQAVAAVVDAALAEESGLAEVPYVVRGSTTREEVPGDRSVVAVRVAQAPRQMLSLIDAELEIVVGTPAQSDATSVAGHALVEAAVDRVFHGDRTIGEGEHEQSIDERLSDEIAARLPDYIGGGFFNRGWTPGREDTAWLPSLSVLVGAYRPDIEIGVEDEDEDDDPDP
jgi:hypothetical protein